ncbi:unnamed protein product [Vitrella brassicaformis CCMP3155]|uniref:Uncharacterized protein n=1 Tax=Vitrella brassicaformis (strain CCMP3155) TaxID=1169540 RepID=A0A0G4FVN5_VITBC|nr:unnamed protein product [Vitrella brassicaformis CCMP3155]|mmetsp:Transcript_17880/g.42995  ORF Transcript_17880/g.42995 Transcript_17880/m.42995 type:complete len:602 (-) Transcript_17880:40-1845(-)|eukprot:CEM19217.1 unnamed protein product [Vitrella brassicaformis CCMP3155]
MTSQLLSLRRLLILTGLLLSGLPIHRCQGSEGVSVAPAADEGLQIPTPQLPEEVHIDLPARDGSNVLMPGTVFMIHWDATKFNKGDKITILVVRADRLPFEPEEAQKQEGNDLLKAIRFVPHVLRIESDNDGEEELVVTATVDEGEFIIIVTNADFSKYGGKSVPVTNSRSKELTSRPFRIESNPSDKKPPPPPPHEGDDADDADIHMNSVASEGEEGQPGAGKTAGGGGDGGDSGVGGDKPAGSTVKNFYEIYPGVHSPSREWEGPSTEDEKSAVQTGISQGGGLRRGIRMTAPAETTYSLNQRVPVRWRTDGGYQGSILLQLWEVTEDTSEKPLTAQVWPNKGGLDLTLKEYVNANSCGETQTFFVVVEQLAAPFRSVRSPRFHVGFPNELEEADCPPNASLAAGNGQSDPDSLRLVADPSARQSGVRVDEPRGKKRGAFLLYRVLALVLSAVTLLLLGAFIGIFVWRRRKRGGCRGLMCWRKKSTTRAPPPTPEQNQNQQQNQQNQQRQNSNGIAQPRNNEKERAGADNAVDMEEPSSEPDPPTTTHEQQQQQQGASGAGPEACTAVPSAPPTPPPASAATELTINLGVTRAMEAHEV